MRGVIFYSSLPKRKSEKFIIGEKLTETFFYFKSYLFQIDALLCFHELNEISLSMFVVNVS